MSNTAAVRYGKQFMIRTDQEFLDALDRIRNMHLPALSRADMIRKLVLESDREAKRAGHERRA